MLFYKLRKTLHLLIKVFISKKKKKESLIWTVFHFTVACDFAVWIGHLNLFVQKNSVMWLQGRQEDKQIRNKDVKKKKKRNEKDIKKNTPQSGELTDDSFELLLKFKSLTTNKIQLTACIWPWASGSSSLTANLTWKHLLRTCGMSHRSFFFFFFKSAQKTSTSV